MKGTNRFASTRQKLNVWLRPIWARRTGYGTVVAVAVGGLLLLAGASTRFLVRNPLAPTSPNVILILTDDQGWGDLSLHGNPYLQTPVMDKLAHDGVQFERFYVSPLCAPTRASLLTGRYHLRTGVASVTGGLETMRSEETTLAEAFRGAGYRTGIFGKWHNGAHYPETPNGQGFEEFLGFCGGHWTTYFNPPLQHNGQPVKPKGYITDILTDSAIGFIDKNRAKPFFCYLPYNALHGPFQVPDAYFDPYKAKGLSDQNAAIYGMVKNLDDNIGRVLLHLEKAGLSDNTIVVFMTDNGPLPGRYNGIMKGTKGTVDEGGVRVPLFIRWPGQINKGMTVGQMAAHIDLFPTLLELAGVPMPKTLPQDGKSLVPLIRNPAAAWPERSIFSHVYKGEKLQPTPGAIRTTRYRFVVDKEQELLYDMTTDPGQKQNIAAEKKDVTQTLMGHYKTWFTDVTKAGIAPEVTQVGYALGPRVELFTPDAALSGNLRFYGKHGYVHDWLVGWQQPDDAVSWRIDVVKAGKHDIKLRYNCPESFVGMPLQVCVDDVCVQTPIQRAFDSPLVVAPNRVPDIAVPDREWAELDMGTVSFAKGPHTLRVKRPGPAMAAPLELKSVVLQQR